MTKEIYLLWFVQERHDNPDTELLIGAFHSQEDADLVIQDLKGKPGFCLYPEGFRVHAQQVGQIGWAEGFIEDGTTPAS